METGPDSSPTMCTVHNFSVVYYIMHACFYATGRCSYSHINNLKYIDLNIH